MKRGKENEFKNYNIKKGSREIHEGNYMNLLIKYKE